MDKNIQLVHEALEKYPDARLSSKSMDKLNALCRVAETFLTMGGLAQFSEIDVQLTWDNISHSPDDGVEAVVAPLVKATKIKVGELSCHVSA